MKSLSYLSMLLLLVTVTSCEVIGDIFSAGFYAGIFVVVAVIALIFWLIRKRG